MSNATTYIKLLERELPNHDILLLHTHNNVELHITDLDHNGHQFDLESIEDLSSHERRLEYVDRVIHKTSPRT